MQNEEIISNEVENTKYISPFNNYSKLARKIS